MIDLERLTRGSLTIRSSELRKYHHRLDVGFWLAIDDAHEGKLPPIPTLEEWLAMQPAQRELLLACALAYTDELVRLAR